MAQPVSKLSEGEISDRLARLAGWKVQEGKLSKTFDFDDFMGAVDFVNKVAQVAEREGHHPDLVVSWGPVIIYLTTHCVGGLTTNDFNVASPVEEL